MLNKFVQKITHDMKCSTDFKISHVHREGNREVDVLSKSASLFKEVHKYQLEDICNILIDDKDVVTVHMATPKNLEDRSNR